MKLSQKFCESAPRGVYWDSQLPGFGLRVHAKTRTYVLYVRDRSKKKTQTVIGHVGDLTLHDARERARELKKHKDKTPERESLTIARACEIYLSEWSIPRKRSSAKDKSRIERLILPTLGARAIESLRVADISGWHREISAKYEANRALEVLSGAIGYCIKQDLIACKNPCIGVAQNREKARTRYFDMSEIERLKEAVETIPECPRVAILLLLYTGCRKMEVLAMEWDRVNLSSAIGAHLALREEDTKTGESRLVALSAVAVGLFDSLPRVGRYVFPSVMDSKTYMHASSLDRWWKIACKAARLDNAHIHDLRRTYISQAAMAGVPAEHISKAAGHDVGMTLRYMQIDLACAFACADKFANAVDSVKNTPTPDSGKMLESRAA